MRGKSDDKLSVVHKIFTRGKGNGPNKMIELIATLIITTSSAALFAYWFRYTCMLILRAKTTRDYAASVAEANQLSFVHVQATLREASPDLAVLKDALDRDYKVLTYLLKHASNPSSADTAIEDRMLEVNYKLMQAWYSACRHFSPAAARRALDEMTTVVAHFANAMGERAVAGAAA